MAAAHRAGCVRKMWILNGRTTAGVPYDNGLAGVELRL
jgi:hypothetical protein